MWNRFLFGAIGIALAIVLILTLIPTNPAITAGGILSISTGLGQEEEVISLRTQTSRTVRQIDGSYSMEVSGGAIHYWNNGWQPINNEIVNGVMEKDDYTFKVLQELFNYGQVVEFSRKGQYIRFQPMELQWTNALEQISSISMPQGVIGVVSNEPSPSLANPDNKVGTIRWDDAYGVGSHCQWVTSTGKLEEILQLDGIPLAPPQYIIDGGSPALRLSFIFDPSSNLDIYVDDILWDRSTKKQTYGEIKFSAGNETLWSFVPAFYHGNETGEEVWTPVYEWVIPDLVQGANWANPNSEIGRAHV